MYQWFIQQGAKEGQKINNWKIQAFHYICLSVLSLWIVCCACNTSRTLSVDCILRVVERLLHVVDGMGSDVSTSCPPSLPPSPLSVLSCRPGQMVTLFQGKASAHSTTSPLATLAVEKRLRCPPVACASLCPIAIGWLSSPRHQGVAQCSSVWKLRLLTGQASEPNYSRKRRLSVSLLCPSPASNGRPTSTIQFIDRPGRKTQNGCQ